MGFMKVYLNEHNDISQISIESCGVVQHQSIRADRSPMRTQVRLRAPDLVTPELRPACFMYSAWLIVLQKQCDYNTIASFVAVQKSCLNDH